MDQPGKQSAWLLLSVTLLVLYASTAGAENLAPIVDALDPPLPAPDLGDHPDVAAGRLDPLPVQWTDLCGQCNGEGCLTCQPAIGVSGTGLKLFGGVDYLAARPSFSEPLAFVRQVRPTVAGPNGVLQNTDQNINFDFGRQDTLRAFIGLRQRHCQSELRLTYWRFRSDSQRIGTAGTDTNGNEIRYTIWLVNALEAGDRLTATSRLAGDVYDIQYRRRLRRMDSCDAMGICCVPWSLDWSTGLRITEWSNDTSIVSTAASAARAEVAMEFDGAGPMVGFTGRRPIRVLPRTSFYTTFQTALLLGQYDHTLIRTSTSGPNTSREVFLSGQKRVVPVTEFEAGIHWQFGRYATLAGGWFYQVWWDLGMDDDVVQGEFGLVRDDANIMAWDSLSVRAEFSF